MTLASPNTTPINQYRKHYLGAPTNAHNTTALLLGAGELGKEIAIEFMRLGVRVEAADSYADAPACQIAHASHVLDMADSQELASLIDHVQPDIIIPEIEAIDTEVLTQAAQHCQVVPSSRVTRIAMDRRQLRMLAHEELGLPTTKYAFANSLNALGIQAERIGYPCVIKPLMSSSGHGQSVVHSNDQLADAWHEAQTGQRASSHYATTDTSVIVEALVPLAYELTVITISSSAGITTCEPIAQCQEHGDYRESWQPANIPEHIRNEAQRIAQVAVSGLTQLAHDDGEYGWGVYGVELFVLQDETILFNELSPRPHDTGMVTMISQRYSEFALHALAILGVPIYPEHTALLMPSNNVAASHAIVLQGNGTIAFSDLEQSLTNAHSSLRIFGKPTVHGHRRMAVALAIGEGEQAARKQAARIAASLSTHQLQ